MEKQHITYFKVENFKKFESLEVKNIGQFNLIVGDNNVGKTCLLEALLFDEDIKIFSYNLNHMLKIRGFINREENKRMLELYENISANIYKKRLSRDINNPVYYAFSYGEEKIKDITINDVGMYSNLFEDILGKEFSFSEINEINNMKRLEPINFPFIAFNSNYGEDIYDLYNSLRTRNDKANLLQVLKTIEPNIIDIELRQNFEDLDSVFLLELENKEEFIPLNYFGDGFRRTFYIALKILSLKEKRIMIDEIETGIHHSRQKNFFKNIIAICNILNVQFFATTHSEECIKSFYEAILEEDKSKELRLIGLEEENDKIYATTYGFENIEAGLTSNIDMRK